MEIVEVVAYSQHTANQHTAETLVLTTTHNGKYDLVWKECGKIEYGCGGSTLEECLRNLFKKRFLLRLLPYPQVFHCDLTFQGKAKEIWEKLEKEDKEDMVLCSEQNQQQEGHMEIIETVAYGQNQAETLVLAKRNEKYALVWKEYGDVEYGCVGYTLEECLRNLFKRRWECRDLVFQGQAKAIWQELENEELERQRLETEKRIQEEKEREKRWKDMCARMERALKMFRRKKITIATYDGEEVVSAVVWKCWAIHRSLNKKHPSKWTLSHIPTGKAFVCYHRREYLAILAEMLDQNGGDMWANKEIEKDKNMMQLGGKIVSSWRKEYGIF
jgi:hypothetical protein